MDDVFHLKAPFQPTGDQPQAIDALVQGINAVSYTHLTLPTTPYV